MIAFSSTEMFTYHLYQLLDRKKWEVAFKPGEITLVHGPIEIKVISIGDRTFYFCNGTPIPQRTPIYLDDPNTIDLHMSIMLTALDLYRKAEVPADLVDLVKHTAEASSA